VALLIGPCLGCFSRDSSSSGSSGPDGSSTPSTDSGSGASSSDAAGMSSSEGGSSSASDASSSGVDAGSTASSDSSASSTDGALEAGIDGSVDGAAASGEGGAAAGCAGKTYKLCEDYNTGTVGQLPAEWTLVQSFGNGSSQNVGLATDEFHSPPMSLKTDDLGNADAARSLRSLAGLGVTATKHWGRIYFKTQVPTAIYNGYMQNTWVALRAAEGDTEVVDTVTMSNGMHQWLTIAPQGDSCGFGSAYDWTFDDAWHCAEWNIDGPTSGSYRFFFDSTEVTIPGVAGSTCTEVANGFTGVVVGSLTYIHPPAPRIIWFDDLAIDDNRIGCN